MKEKKKDVQMAIIMEERNQKQVLVINPDTHEVVSKAQKEAFKETLEKMAEVELDRRLEERGLYVQCKSESLKTLEESDWTIADRRYLMLLILYARFNGEPLAKDGILLTPTIISNMWGLSLKKGSERLTRLVNVGVLQRIKQGRNTHFLFNDSYFSMGKGTLQPDEKFVKLFQRKLHDVINKVQKDANRKKTRREKDAVEDVLGLLCALIPYFHFQTYYLVSNPDIPVTKKNETVLESQERGGTRVLKHLSRFQIGQILGLKRARTETIDNYMRILQDAGAVVKLSSEKRIRYIVHPDLMFRMDSSGSDDYSRYVRGLFGEHSYGERELY